MKAAKLRVNESEIEWVTEVSPKETYASHSKRLSALLDGQAPEWSLEEPRSFRPFEVDLVRVPPGKRYVPSTFTRSSGSTTSSFQASA